MRGKARELATEPTTASNAGFLSSHKDFRGSVSSWKGRWVHLVDTAFSRVAYFWGDEKHTKKNKKIDFGAHRKLHETPREIMSSQPSTPVFIFNNTKFLTSREARAGPKSICSLSVTLRTERNQGQLLRKLTAARAPRVHKFFKYARANCLKPQGPEQLATPSTEISNMTRRNR